MDLHDVLDYTSALKQTEQLLQRDKVVIAEAAFGIGNMFIRADIVRKDGKHIDLIEVKAKSFNPETAHEGKLQEILWKRLRYAALVRYPK